MDQSGRRPHSLIRRVVVLLVVQLTLVTFLFGTFCLTSYASALRDMQTMTDNLLSVYCAELDGALSRADSVLQNIVVDKSTSLALMQSKQENERFYAGNEVFQSLKAAVQGDSGIDMLVAAENTYQSSYHAEKNGALTLAQRENLLEFTRQQLAEYRPSNVWHSVMMEDGAYLYRYYMMNGRIVAAYLRAEELSAQLLGAQQQDISYFVTDRRGDILAAQGDAAQGIPAGTPSAEVSTRGYLVRDKSFGGGAFTLRAFAVHSGIVRQFRAGLLGVGLLLAVLLIFSFLQLEYTRKSVLRPLNCMTGELQSMKEREESLRLTGSFDSAEFSLLQTSFNRLMDENVTLRMNVFRRRIELQDTELRCIRLQLRPHFFLNAMTTISSLSMQGRNEEIKTYINALSRNIRYMFRSGVHTVPLQEELLHVNYYLEMQELKYPDAVFYLLQQQPGTDDWPVPQMLIHTVMENEYKHAVTVGQTLTILVDIQIQEQDGEPMLCIGIEDDGAGYPPEMTGNAALHTAKDGSHVGLHAIDRMLTLMYDRDGLMELSNVEPHGARTVLRVPCRPLHEYREQNDETGKGG